MRHGVLVVGLMIGVIGWMILGGAAQAGGGVGPLGDFFQSLSCISPPQDPGYCERQVDRRRQQQQWEEMRQMQQRQEMQQQLDRLQRQTQQPVQCTYRQWSLGGRMLCVMPDGSVVAR